MAEHDDLIAAKDETISILRGQLREEREARRRADTLLAQLTQTPPASEGALEEARKEIARRLVRGAFGLAIFTVSSITSVISYFNGASTATIILAAAAVVSAIVTALVGTYFGIKASSDAAEGAQRMAGGANTTAEQATQEPQEDSRDDG